MTSASTSQRHTVYIGIGSNLDDPRAQVLRAIELLRAGPDFERVEASPLYATPPWGVEDQPPFVNAVARAQTALEPEAALDALLALEERMGRRRYEKWGPRRIDLDLLLHGCAVIRTKRLILPHPYITERAFVLRPLLDLAPNLADPQTQTPYSNCLPSLQKELAAIMRLDN